jgi:hypothetical protein
MKRTISENLFENFCIHHKLNYQRVAENTDKTPDYHLRFGEITVAVEIKQIESLEGFNPGGVSSRTAGSHVRQKISEARQQLQPVARSGIATILLIHNTVDPLQLFGTEQHDFLSAMYGELTIRIDRFTLEKSPMFHGRNARFRQDANTSFSGVGHLRRTIDGAHITVYENVYASQPLPFNALPPSIEVMRVEIENAA